MKKSRKIPAQPMAGKKAQARNPSASKKSGVNHQSKAKQPMGRQKDKATMKSKGKEHKKMVAKAASALFNSQQPNPPSGGATMAGGAQ